MEVHLGSFVDVIWQQDAMTIDAACCSESHIFIVMLSAVGLNVIMLNVTALSAVMLNGIMLNATVLRAFMLSAFMLNVIC
jgi:hypothetical protein